MTAYAPIDLAVFPPEREQRLKEIFRFSLFKTALYRANLWEHEHRVSWLVEELAPLLASHLTFDAEKARTLALVHDDPELITGDVQAGRKAQMTKEQLAELDRAEEAAIAKIAEEYPKEINGFNYRELLLMALRKDTPEAQVVSYADKLDAYCESVHESLAGNYTIFTSMIFYGRFFAQVRARLPILASAFDAAVKSPLIDPFIVSPPDGVEITVDDYRRFFGPYTEEAIKTDTGYFPFYDAWKQIVLAKGGEEGKSWLLTQREFMPA
jgi:5'-deoxynucleotidase YfbR-like HD superfamily hydrolase